MYVKCVVRFFKQKSLFFETQKFRNAVCDVSNQIIAKVERISLYVDLNTNLTIFSETYEA